MTKKKGFLVVLAAVLTGTLGLLLVWPYPRINKSTMAQVKEGMPKDELKLLFGAPPGVYCDRSIWLNAGKLRQDGVDSYVVADDVIKSFEDNKAFGEDTSIGYWISSTGACFVVFDENECALYWEIYEVEPRTLWDRLKGWIACLRFQINN